MWSSDDIGQAVCSEDYRKESDDVEIEDGSEAELACQTLTGHSDWTEREKWDLIRS